MSDLKDRVGVLTGGNANLIVNPGDLLTGDGDQTVYLRGDGIADGMVLTRDSTVEEGLSWQPGSGGGGAGVFTTLDVSGQSTLDDVSTDGTLDLQAGSNLNVAAGVSSLFRATDLGGASTVTFQGFAYPHAVVNAVLVGDNRAFTFGTINSTQLVANLGLMIGQSDAGNVCVGFFGTPPIAQPAAVADATGAGDVVAQLNALLARMRSLGLIDT